MRVQVVQRGHQLAPHRAHHRLGQAAVVLQNMEELACGGWVGWWVGGRGMGTSRRPSGAPQHHHARRARGSCQAAPHARQREARRQRRTPGSERRGGSGAPCANSVTTQKSFLVSKASSMAMMLGWLSLRRISISWRRLQAGTHERARAARHSTASEMWPQNEASRAAAAAAQRRQHSSSCALLRPCHARGNRQRCPPA